MVLWFDQGYFLDVCGSIFLTQSFLAFFFFFAFWHTFFCTLFYLFCHRNRLLFRCFVELVHSTVTFPTRRGAGPKAAGHPSCGCGSAWTSPAPPCTTPGRLPTTGAASRGRRPGHGLLGLMRSPAMCFLCRRKAAAK